MKHNVVDRLASSGITSVADFSGLQTNVEGMRRLLIRTFLFQETLEDMAQLSRICTVWETAKKEVAARTEVKAANKAHGDTVEMLRSEFQKLVESLEQCRGNALIDTDVLPGRGVVEDLLEQIEEGELVADSLAEVVCHRNEEFQRKKDAMEPQLSVRTNGTLRRKTRRITGKMPNNTEDFRERFRILHNAWELVALKLPRARAVRGLVHTTWGDHADWILGKEVAQFEISVRDRRTAPPTWDMVFEFEWYIRVRAAREVNRRKLSLAEALAEARADKELYWRRFTSPMGVVAKFLEGRAASSAHSAFPSPHTSFLETPSIIHAPQVSSQQGQDVGARMNKVEKLLAELVTAMKRKAPMDSSSSQPNKSQRTSGRKGNGRGTPPPPSVDGRRLIKFFMKTVKLRKLLNFGEGADRICFAFQKHDTCTRDGCIYKHVCAVCGGTKGMDNCTFDRTDLEARLSAM